MRRSRFITQRSKLQNRQLTTKIAIFSFLDIAAKNANLEDFKIPNIQTQGVSSIKNSPSDGKLFYYVVIPSSQKSFEFDYFNKEKGESQKISVSLDLTKIEDKVSTQTDLQPKSTDKAIYVFFDRCRNRCYFVRNLLF